MRILFTGGSGKAGRHVVTHLANRGHTVMNLDLVPANIDGVWDMTVDLTDAGQVFSAMSGIVGFDDLESADGPPKFDAVVHFAAVPRIQLRPDPECFRVNTTSTYNVLEAAVKLGIPKVLFASSETTYGVCFAHGEVKPEYIPVDEKHPTVPHDAYAMSKVCNEVCGRSFQARSGTDLYALRINNVIEPHEYASLVPVWSGDAACRRRNIFAYIDTRDLSHFVDCALATDGLGFQVFNVANEDSSVGMPSAEVIANFYAGVPQRRELGEFETFYSIDKAKELLGFAAPSRWRNA
ncbi:NAD-dependent epimerase/dehydratase [Rhodopirellula baltica SH28]|uniref:NAD-dependent epimerase/dehydratase n=1 Tax=Rhodopirellula baltica SH28 TaxID=993517 RepID=K5DND4_RHOBT|nr:NAD(P)-dependent oxidoreductase [Rhodopirellula baltica]EKK04008.1 NAD-dependent epimerase/dehydratase [Rhodopirellula baltica SH28]